MFWKDFAYLCYETKSLDEYRKPVVEYFKKEVFCNKKGIKRNEFYQAQIAGIKPELCIEIKEADFEKETHLDFENAIYRIIRSYPTKNENIELICTALVNEDG